MKHFPDYLFAVNNPSESSGSVQFGVENCGQVQFVAQFPEAFFTVNTCTCTYVWIWHTLIRFLSFTAPSNIPVGQKKMTTATATAPAPAAATAAAVDDEEEGWFTLRIAFKHRHTSA